MKTVHTLLSSLIILLSAGIAHPFGITTQDLVGAAKASVLGVSILLTHEAGHALASVAYGDKAGMLGIGGPPSNQPIFETKRIKVFGFNPFRYAYRLDPNFEPSTMQKAIIHAGGPLAALAFTHVIGNKLALHSLSAHINEGLKIFTLAECFPSTIGSSPSDGMQMCTTLGLNPTLGRLVVGPLVLYKIYSYIQQCTKNAI